MPPQQTDVISEPGHETSGLRLAITLVEDTTGGALAAARPDASVAALTTACSDGEAAGSHAASRQGFLSLLQRCWRAFQQRRQRERLRVSLRDLNDRQLKDIGLAPGNIDCIAAHRAIEKLKDETTYRWLSRGVM